MVVLMRGALLVKMYRMVMMIVIQMSVRVRNGGEGMAKR